ncbi:MAG: TetR/AcrR family transcriptional regulator [Cyanobacteria bacterium J06648_16]
MDGAMQEFLAHGYAATSMDRVASTAGVSKATIYSHFKDKADLFAAIMQQLAEHKFATVFDPRDRTALQGDLRTVLRDLALKMCDQAQCDARFSEFMRLIIGESGRFPELAQPYVEKVAKPIIESLTEYLAQQTNPTFKDPEVTARTLLGTMVYFVMLQEILHGKVALPLGPDRMVDGLIDLILPVAETHSHNQEPSLETFTESRPSR